MKPSPPCPGRPVVCQCRACATSRTRRRRSPSSSMPRGLGRRNVLSVYAARLRSRWRTLMLSPRRHPRYVVRPGAGPAAGWLPCGGSGDPAFVALRPVLPQWCAWLCMAFIVALASCLPSSSPTGSPAGYLCNPSIPATCCPWCPDPLLTASDSQKTTP